MTRDKRIEVGQDGSRRVVLGSTDRELNNETSRVIRKIMGVIERYTDYQQLEDDKRSIVRDTVLNQINRLVRVARHKQTIYFGDK